MPVNDMATATGTVSLIRQIGGTVGIAVSGAMYGSRLKSRLESIAGYNLPRGSAAVGNVNGLQSIQPLELSKRVVHAYTRSLSDPWIISAPLIFFGFLISFLLKQYSLERNVVRAETQVSSSSSSSSKRRGKEEVMKKEEENV
jgi:hypothetical protein